MPKVSLKAQLFAAYQLDATQDEQKELERGLRIAVAKNHVARLPYFFAESLEVKIDINAQGLKTGKTALHLAVEKGHVTVVEALLQRGARYDIADQTGYTAVERAQGTALAVFFPPQPKEEAPLPLGCIIS